MVLTKTPVCNFGEKAHDFTLPDIYGNTRSLIDCRGEKGTLIMFICNHCPYVKAIQLRLVEATKNLLNIGVNSIAIMSNDISEHIEDSPCNMKKIAEEFRYPFPYLFDETQEVAKMYGALCTPDFFGYNSKMELQYRGRFNSAGMKKVEADVSCDLLMAMIEIGKTGKGPKQQTPSIGCSIKWK